MECFPGGQFYNITKVLEGAYDNSINVSGIKHVILSVGINNRDSKSSTAVDNLRRLRTAANRLFPAAEIYLCEINYSAKLRTIQKDNLDRINDAIRTNRTCNHIPRMPAQIRCERDPIHWTEDSANQLLVHWLSNLKSEN